MLGLGLGINRLTSRIGAIASSFNLSSALHEWNYQNATDVGTTVTMPDTGSIGGLDMANPDAASEPTLTASAISFDGVSEIIKKDTVDFRGSDTSGVLHFYFNNVSGAAQRFFTASETVDNDTYVEFYVNSFDQGIFLIRIDGTISQIAPSTTLSAGWHLVSVRQTGSDCKVWYDGVKQTSYTVDTILSKWYNYVVVQTKSLQNVAIGGRYSGTPNYQLMDVKYGCYTAYTTDAALESDAQLIINEFS
jgi:hypothetical protein